MTVLLGLPDRLKAVRLLVTVDARRGWGDIVKSLPPKCGAVVVMPPGGQWTPISVGVLRADWAGIDSGKRLIGMDVSAESNSVNGEVSPGHAAAAELLPDIVIEEYPTQGWPHQWALHGVRGDHAGASDQGVDLRLLRSSSPDLRGGGKPRFAVVGGLAEARSAIDAGATRLAWHIVGKTLFGRLKPPAGDLLKADALLSDAWRQAHPDKPTGKIPR